MDELSPDAKKMICILLDRVSIGKIHILIGQNYLAVAEELETLQKQLEQDVLAAQPDVELKLFRGKDRPVTTEIEFA